MHRGLPSTAAKAARLAAGEGQAAAAARLGVHVQTIGRVEAETTVGDHKAIVPSIEGSAVATGFNTIWVDRRDPFWAGFQVV